jgi:hypothetical protein
MYGAVRADNGRVSLWSADADLPQGPCYSGPAGARLRTYAAALARLRRAITPPAHLPAESAAPRPEDVWSGQLSVARGIYEPPNRAPCVPAAPEAKLSQC